MGRKIFISYKYADSNVKQLNNSNNWYSQDTVRNYVDILENYLKEKSDHIYKGESDGEDISYLSEASIRDKLYDRIYDSTLTINMVSPGMKEAYKEQKYQWIPQEISYSLREQSRSNSKGQSITSSRNAMLAVILPDRYGNYDYYTYQCSLCSSKCTVHKTNWLFPIMKENTFNIKKPDSESCNTNGSTIYQGYPSYISYVKWADFKSDPEKYIELAYDIQSHKDEYDIHVQL